MEVDVAWVIKGLAHGGAQQIVADLSPLIHERGYRVVVLSTKRLDALRPQLEARGIETRVTPRDVHWPLWLTRQLTRGEFDLVHTHSPLAASFVSALRPVLGRTQRFPRWVIDTGHNDVAVFKPATRLVNNHTTRWRDAIIATSDIARQGAANETVVHHGIATASVRRRPAWRSESVLRIVMAAGLRPQKDHRTLLLAAGELREAGIDFELHLLGDGELRSELEALTNDLDLTDHVRFLGWRTDVREILATYDLFVLSTHAEGFPISLVEAITADLPCVATDVPGNREVLIAGDGAVCGALVAPQDPAALARAILAESTTDRTDARRQRSAELGIEHTVDAYVQCYESLTGLGP